MFDERYQEGAAIPKAVGARADLLHEVRELRLEMQKEVEAVARRESEIRESIIADLDSSDDTGAIGLRYQVRIVKKTKPRAADWDAIWDYVLETGRRDFFQKRLSDKAVMDTLEAEGEVPGVELIHLPELSLTKIKR